MATAADIIKGSLRLLGAIATGETPSASETADGLSALNDMLDSWSNEGLAVFAREREVFALTPSLQAHTMGTSGTFNTTRPNDIEEVKILSGTLETHVEIINFEQWSQVGIKSTASDIPTQVYIERGFPLLTLNFWPIPSVANSAVIYSRKSLTAFALSSTTVSLPPGYSESLKFNLAVRLAPEFGTAASAEVIAFAMESKDNLKRANLRPQYLDGSEISCMASGNGSATFNFYSGD